MKKQDLAAAGKRKLEEFRKKKDKTSHAATVVLELENGNAEEESRPDPNMWRRALENEVNTLRSENGRLQAELLREQREKADLQAQVMQVQTNASSMATQLQRVEEERRKAEEQAYMLRRNMETISGERNAAIAAKEDLAAQLRVARRRLQEAEEEQYRAEEDTAALRAEVARLEALSHGHVRRPSQEIPQAENELDKARAELQMTLTELQSSQQSVAVERQRQGALSSQLAEVASEKDELEHTLIQTRDKLQELQERFRASQARIAAAEREVADAKVEAAEARREADSRVDALAPRTPERTNAIADDAERAELEEANAGLVNEKRKLEGKCKELAMMVERQEKGRQKLLTEIDSQSLEIERLFGENAGLHAGLNEYTAIASRWEQQVHELLGQNQELRAALRHVREEQRAMEEARSAAPDAGGQKNQGKDMVPAVEVEEARAREARLKKQLTQALARAEELAEQCAQLSADYNQVTHAMANLSRAYQPLLTGIESRLLLMRQDAA